MVDGSKKKNLVKVIILVILLFVFVQYLLPDVNSPEFREFVQSSGILGPLAIILYIITAHIIAPLLGTPVNFLSAAVFGIVKTMLFIYIAGLISSVANFYISRRLGRKWVKKLAGEKNLAEIDKFMEVLTTEMFILARVFGFALFDVISYAAGFTKISFKKYFIITAVFPLIPLSIFAFMFRDFDFSSRNSFATWAVVFLLFGVVSALYLKKHLYKKLK